MDLLHPNGLVHFGRHARVVVDRFNEVEGNPAGAVAALVFLDLNGMEIDAPSGHLYDMTIAVPTGQAGKAEIAEFFRSHAG